MNKSIQIQLTGLRPLMFDRYAGDNNTKLQPHELMYLDSAMRLTIPAINLYSMLCAENTKSVCRQFFGKAGKTIALGIAGYTSIDPFEILLQDEHGPITFSEFGSQVYVHRSVARLNKGIPNPKARPTLALPWHLDFTVKYSDNKYCTIENLRQAFQMGGSLGLGTFRPFFGTYELTGWEE
jgi:hypothetical protein